MKKLTIHTFIQMTFAGAILFLAACNRTPTAKNHANWADSTFTTDTAKIDQQNKREALCFVQRGSAPSKDSSFINLAIAGDKVTGTYSWIPFEKDSRTGSINGIRKGDTIDVVWSYMQEGMRDTLRTVFLLQSDELKQKPYTINQKNGRQVTNDRSQFTISYQKINCK